MRIRTVVIGGLTLAAACAKEQPKAPPADSTAVAAPAPLPPGEGYLSVPDGRIWYRVTGTGSGTPLILLHGGPGYSSYYLKLFERLGDDRRVVRYDQVGSGKSGTLSDTSKMNIPHFVAELDSLRSHLGFTKVHILGHSWGTMLGFEYARAHPDRIASLILASPVMNVPAYAKHAQDLLRTISDSGRKAVAEAVKTGKFDTPGYKAANDEFWVKYVMRSPAAAVQADLDSTLTQVNETIYNYMQGPSEFTITGTFKDFDATRYFKDVKFPVLFTVGDNDEVGPDLVKRHAAMLPGAKYQVIKGSGHLTPWDAPDQSLTVVRDFLRAVDGAGK